MNYRIEDKRLYVDGSPVSLFSGSVQYWRLKPGLWEEILRRVKGMGFGIIETYMPWSVHEASPGRFDFGETDPRLDVRRFLELCDAAGIKVLARPGPHINAELTYFGYPERIFADEEVLCRCADGTPVVLPAPPRMFPAPCYHHPRFLSGVREYFEALAGVVGNMIHPGGPVIAIQADNECSKFFRVHPFDHDYSEYSVRLYRGFLAAKYGDVEELNRVYRSRYDAFELVDPPRAFKPAKPEDLPYYLDWVQFGEHYINESLRSIAGIIRECFGEGVPLFHNYPSTMPVPPFNIPAAEEFLDFQGIDAYPQRSHYHQIRRGIKMTSTESRLPLLMEFSSGGIYYARPISLQDQEFTTWSALMHGIKGINFYMIVERERWYGSPVKRDGSLRPRHYDFYRRFLEEVRQWGLEDMSPDRPVLLLINREYERLVSAATLLCPNSSLVSELTGTVDVPDGLFVSEEHFGLSEPVAGRYLRLRSFWYWALTAAGVHFAIGDTCRTADLTGGHPLVIVPTFEFLGRELQERMVEYARGGGALVVGPRAPVHDETMKPCDVLGRHMRGPVEVRPGGKAFGAAALEVSLFEDETGSGRGATPLYRNPVGSGWLIHLGIVPGDLCNVADAEPFGPLVDTLLCMGGVDPAFVPSDSRIDVSVLRGDGRELLLVANPTHEAITTVLSHTKGASYRDLRTGEATGVGGAITVSLEPYTIRALGKA
ncbi:MAG: beta-galactosidase [Actinobacteria bacterium]|nr:beta-galactosidase [Actinomycetota bacterium]